MTIQDFLNTFLLPAQKSELKTGVPYLVTLCQAALESGWGEHAPGFNFFGIKGQPGQLLRTTEYHNNPNVKYPVIISVVKAGDNLWKYVVRDYFKVYPNPSDSFVDHGLFLRKNTRYSNAFNTKDPDIFIDRIAQAGYASDPNYADKLKGIKKQILSLIQ